MANIPIEKKSGSPMWLWLLLGAIALIVLLCFIFNDDDDTLEQQERAAVTANDGEFRDLQAPEVINEDANNDDINLAKAKMMPVAGIQRETGPAATVSAETFSAIVRAGDRSNLIGQAIILENLRVTDVIGDASFYVTKPGVNEQILVFLDEKQNVAPRDVEGRYDINAGQTLNLTGRIKSLANANPRQWGWGQSQQEMQQAKGDVIYLHADKLTITERN